MRIMQCNKPFFSHDAFGNAYLFHHFQPFLIPRTLFELSTADRLVESVVRKSLALLRLRLVIGEFIENWGDFKRYIADPLNARREAALRREQEIVAMLAANTRGSSWAYMNMEAESHWSRLWNLISHLADVLENGPDAVKLVARLNRHGASIKLRQLPWHPAAGILWPDRRSNYRDTVCARRKRQREAARLFWAA